MRNAVEIALVEFFILFVWGATKVILSWLQYRQLRKLRQMAEEAELRHQELLDIRRVIGRLDMKPLGEAGRVGKLPDGTNLVETASGKVMLALPIVIEVGDTLIMAEGSAELTVTPPDEKSEE